MTKDTTSTQANQRPERPKGGPQQESGGVTGTDGRAHEEKEGIGRPKHQTRPGRSTP